MKFKYLIFTIMLMLPIHLFAQQITTNIDSEKLQDAIKILDSYPYWKKYVESKIIKIVYGKLTGIIVNNPKEIIYITDIFINGNSRLWIATTIIHEARHVEQVNEHMGLTDQGSELDAMYIQAIALQEMGGSPQEIYYLITSDGLHFDSNGNGILDKDDDWGY